MKKKSSKALIVGFLIITIFLGWILRIDRFGFSNIRWQDFLILNGSCYNAQYIGQEFNSEDRIVVEPSLIGGKIGEVKFTLNEKVSNSHYLKRNLDASLLDKGTEVYELTNESDRNKIVVKIGTEYYLYSKEE